MRQPAGTGERKYLEVTLHMQGGGQVVFAAEELSSSRSPGGDGYTKLNWTHTDWLDLPRLHSVDLPRLTAITTRDVSEPQK